MHSSSINQECITARASAKTWLLCDEVGDLFVRLPSVSDYGIVVDVVNHPDPFVLLVNSHPDPFVLLVNSHDRQFKSDVYVEDGIIKYVGGA